MKKKIIQKMVKIKFDYLVAAQNIIAVIGFSCILLSILTQNRMIMFALWIVTVICMMQAVFIEDVLATKEKIRRRRVFNEAAEEIDFTAESYD